MQLLVLLLAAATTEPNAGPERRPVHVRFSAPGACPTQHAFERELTARTDKVELVGEPVGASAFIEVAISARGSRFEGRLSLKSADGASTSRRLESKRCETVVAALSLAAALLLDPEAKLGTLAEPPPPAQAAVEPPTPEPAPPPEPAPGPVFVPAPVPEPAAQVEAAKSEAKAAKTATLGVVASVLVSTAVAGAPDFGGAAGLALSVALGATPLSLQTRLTGGGLSGRTVAATAGRAAYPLHAVGQLELGIAADVGPVRPELGAALQVLPVQVSGLDGDVTESSLRWLAALGPSARVAVRFSGWEVAAAAGAFAHFNRERYLIEPTGLVFQVPAWFFSGGLQLGRTIP